MVKFETLPISTLVLFIALMMFCGPSHVLASDRFGDSEQGRAYSGVKSGKLLPLSKALSKARRKVKGRVTNIALVRRGGRQVYRVKILKTNGHLVTLFVNAGGKSAKPKKSSKRRGRKSNQAGRAGNSSGSNQNSGSSSSGSGRSGGGNRDNDDFGDRDENHGSRGRGRNRRGRDH